MRCIRAYQEQSLQAGMEVLLDQRVSHHWLHVLRLRSGVEVRLFNGDGRDYPGVLQVLGKREGKVMLHSPIRVAENTAPRLMLLQGLCRGERMDLVLQKATELGVNEIIPLHTEHSQVRLHGARLRKRMQHWRQVMISACEQCGRATLVRLHEPKTVAALATATSKADLRLLLQPDAGDALTVALQRGADGSAVQIAVGPEGGFSAAEVGCFGQAGFMQVHLGDNVLRTETAAITAAALVKLATLTDAG